MIRDRASFVKNSNDNWTRGQNNHKLAFQIENWRMDSFYEFDWISTGMEIGEKMVFDLENVFEFAKMIIKILLPKDDQSQRSDVDIGTFLELIINGTLNTFQIRYIFVFFKKMKNVHKIFQLDEIFLFKSC